ncbi:adenosylcobinamide-GDP ribazoletransferase [Synechococcus moorigangaii CMS01]|nr:adenosylcobinamide-GDP ribazoletransferase [Synechococcus moorigangaii CMS01]
MVRFLFYIMQLWRSLLGAILFYTVLPLPKVCKPSFYRLARWCPWIGLGLGSMLVGLFWGLDALNVTPLLRSVLIVVLWLGVTGGLHLDGAMDSADGLAVTDGDRRLSVMADSVSGAFGVMAGIVILFLKVSALESFSFDQAWFLLVIPAWGRWSQVVAIAFYPYLKPQGKGAFHKQQFHLYEDLCWSIFPLVLLFLIVFLILPRAQWLGWLLVNLCSVFGAIAVSHWFASKFQGHTGDTYGASVEWTEVYCLIMSTLLTNWL